MPAHSGPRRRPSYTRWLSRTKMTRSFTNTPAAIVEGRQGTFAVFTAQIIDQSSLSVFVSGAG
jgi:hypothetical protein